MPVNSFMLLFDVIPDTHDRHRVNAAEHFSLAKFSHLASSLERDAAVVSDFLLKTENLPVRFRASTLVFQIALAAF